MNFPLYIAQRYLFSKSKTNAINIITRIAAVGIVMGSLALFVVLSVFSGLREFSLSFSNDFDPDIKATAIKGKTFVFSPNQEMQIKNLEGIASYSKVLEEKVLFFFDGKEQVAYLKGVDTRFTQTNVIAKNNIFNGKWLQPNSYDVVLGYGISEKLSLGLFDFNNAFEVYVPRKGKNVIESEADAFNKAALIPVGIYAVSEELDSKYVFCDLLLAQKLLELQANEISGIEIKLKPNANEENVILKLRQILGDTISIKNRAQQNATLYKMLNTENFILYLIFTLVIIMILFAFAGAVFMIIIDKKDHLKTLLSLGTPIKSLRSIFLLYGLLLCVISGLIGIALGSAIVFAQKAFNLIMITETLPYPVVFEVQNGLIVLVTITFLGFISSWIASSRVSKALFD
ncbi:ABC transporter permease [Flavobacterium sedimenticola]|uniref:ABC transporter permease n=1 Tax=Flavobacterium sedimenticola TaxID=3043286 RepID=A0ABT6XLM8_9FLAO|nr:FtsX-like permease family protein [Flavobacterium sedimenticola]MDI9255995.1 ABC transporter permease [Flavobacterium sedimenticola]